jgi:hypothetical protein
MKTLKVSSEFVEGKNGIGYVSSGFEERFGDREFTEVKKAPTFKKLPRAMTDAEIEGELKLGICSLGDVLAFLKNPPKESKDGYWNLFYFADCVVHVSWGSLYRLWSIDAWRRGNYRWYEGTRVFSPATEKKTKTMKLKLLEDNLIIPKTSGKKTISQKTKLFSWIDPDFGNYGADEKGKPKPKTKCAIYELVENATFHEMFEELGDPENLCLTQEQIIEFVKKHKEELNQDGWANFFLFESNGQLFVADVCVDSGGELEVRVDRFEYSSVWHGDCPHRVVVPQLAGRSHTRDLELDSLTLELDGKKYKVEGEIKLKEIK